ncbi:MAG: TolC family protein [Planctomycetota bacterium]
MTKFRLVLASFVACLTLTGCQVPSWNLSQGLLGVNPQNPVESATDLEDALQTDGSQTSDDASVVDAEQPGFESTQDESIVTAAIKSVEDGSPLGIVGLQQVLDSTVDYYPIIQSAFLLDGIATGEQISAAGNFDTKFKLESENTPVGFYETYRQNVGVELPTFQGGSLFGGYRLGRGDMEPWYLERNTNAGGEFKLGARMALLRGREIDARRVELWKANWRRRAVDPEIKQALIDTRQLAEYAYWSWLASGQILKLNQSLFSFATDRQAGIEERIAAGDLPEISKTDNDRTIVSRKAKLIEARAKFEQAATKLSLFYRDGNGNPITLTEANLPEFPAESVTLTQATENMVNDAVTCRPEILLIDIDRKQINIDLAKAKNDLLPRFDFQLATSQDIGRPTSASAAASSSGAVFANFDEKDEFKVDAAFYVNQTLERRKARGKIRSLCAKRDQPP